MTEIENPALLYAKAGLFVFIAVLSLGLLLYRSPSYLNAVLIGAAIWGSCRAYYFAFYVIEHYIDDDYRYAGLTHFLFQYLRRSSDRSESGDDPANISERSE